MIQDEEASRPGWETVHADEERLTQRMQVPGGWLYKHFEVTLTVKKYDTFTAKYAKPEPNAAAVNMCFVPDFGIWGTLLQGRPLEPLVINNAGSPNPEP